MSWGLCRRGRAGVEELYVQPEYRRRGIGRNLMEEVETWFRTQSPQIIRVEVFAPNEGARTSMSSSDTCRGTSTSSSSYEACTVGLIMRRSAVSCCARKVHSGRPPIARWVWP